MKFLKVLGPAAGIAGALVPALRPALTLLNEFLPADKKLPATASGQDVTAAFAALPAEQQQQIDARAQVELAHIRADTDMLTAMVSVESATSNTRPRIAYMMAATVVIAVLVMMTLWTRAAWVGDAAALAQLAGSWELMLAILATPSVLLRAYFGMRTREKTARYAASVGQDVGAGGIVSSLVGMVRGQR